MAYLVIAFCFGLSGGIIGKIKGSSFLVWFLISGLVPVIGLLTAIVYRFEHDEPRRRCPRCGRVRKLYDAVCMRCGYDLDFPEQIIGPASERLIAAASTTRAGAPSASPPQARL